MCANSFVLEILLLSQQESKISGKPSEHLLTWEGWGSKHHSFSALRKRVISASFCCSATQQLLQPRCQLKPIVSHQFSVHNAAESEFSW